MYSKFQIITWKFGKNRSKASPMHFPNNTWLIVSHALPGWMHTFTKHPVQAVHSPPFNKLLKCGALIGIRNLVLELTRALAVAVPGEPTMWLFYSLGAAWWTSYLNAFCLVFYNPLLTMFTLVYSPLAGFPGLYFTPRLTPTLVTIIDFRFIVSFISFVKPG